MHPYSINTEERKTILLALAAISIVLAWGFYKILGIYQISLPWWVESPSVLFFYGLIFIIFDKWAWKGFTKIGLIKTPRLYGDWKGNLKSSFDEHATEKKANLLIYQSWTRIRILLATEHSNSHSETASIVLDTPEGDYISYQYLNEPKADVAVALGIHRGATRLFFDENEISLRGEYFSGRGRQNYGSMYFKKTLKHKK